MSPTTHKILFIKKPTTHVKKKNKKKKKKIKKKKNEAATRPSHTFNSGTALKQKK
jgi:hypothetical protein